jgi:glycosyltransferase involved in cell wall biosynthesis
MDELYANAFAYLHAHEFGGTNPTLLRALAGGNCVLALSTPFNHGVMQEAGMFFDKDVESMANVIQALCDKPEQAELYAQKAQARIREAFTWDLITDQYEDLCQDLRPGR